MMKLLEYDEKYKDQIIDLILHIQNDEAKINLSLDEQPDLSDIPKYYCENGGRFYLAVEQDELIGTIAFMNYENRNAVLKKFFVRADHRGQKVGLFLYTRLLDEVKAQGYQRVLLDTPSAAKASHRFYERAGFVRIEKDKLPFHYEYPDRDSYLYLLEI